MHVIVCVGKRYNNVFLCNKEHVDDIRFAVQDVMKTMCPPGSWQLSRLSKDLVLRVIVASFCLRNVNAPGLL